MEPQGVGSAGAVSVMIVTDSTTLAYMIYLYK